MLAIAGAAAGLSCVPVAYTINGITNNANSTKIALFLICILLFPVNPEYNPIPRFPGIYPESKEAFGVKH